jgi:hypothetical protein
MDTINSVSTKGTFENKGYVDFPHNSRLKQINKM